MPVPQAPSEKGNNINNQVDRLKKSVLPDGISTDFKKGFISIAVDFPSQEQLQKTLQVTKYDQLMQIIVQFLSEMIFSMAPQDIDVTGQTGFDPKKPILLKKVSFPVIPYDGVESGKALKINAWFAQGV